MKSEDGQSVDGIGKKWEVMMRVITIILIICGMLVACKTTEESLRESGNKPLSSTKIKQLFSGKTGSGTSSKGRSYQVTYNTDGTAVLSSGSYSDSGKWWVEGKDTYCSQWTKLRDGAKRCLHIYDIGDKFQSVDMDGYASSTFTLK